jgi:hypothetical protein
MAALVRTAHRRCRPHPGRAGISLRCRLRSVSQ